ncbi:MAG: MMPL family transporter, partial [Rhodospirillales bacterium]
MIRGLTRRHVRLGIHWTNFIRQRAVTVVVLALLSAVAAAVYVGGRLTIDTDTTEMLSPELPFRQAWREEHEAFPQFDDSLVVVVEGQTADLAADGAAALADRLRRRPDLFGSVFHPEGDPFFRRNGLLFLDIAELQELSDRLAAAQPFLGALSADPSLRGLFALLTHAVDRAAVTDDVLPIEIAPVVEAIAGVVEAQAAGRPGWLSWQRLLAGSGHERPADRTRLIMLLPPLDFESMHPAAAATDGIRVAARALHLDPAHGVRVRITGEAALESEELETVAIGMEIAGAVSLVLVVGLLLLCYHSVRAALATLVTLIIGLIWTAAFAVAAVGSLNLISIAFAVLFIGLGVDFGIHYTLRYREAARAGAGHAIALKRAIGGVGGALVLSAVAAAIGFFSFLPTAYIGLAELGLIAGTGMGIALFANTTVLPALLTVFRPSMPSGRGSVRLMAGRTSRAIERHARPILWGALGLGVAAAAAVPWARFDFDPLNLRSRASESVATLLDLTKQGENVLYFLSVVAPDVETAAALAERAATLEPVRATVSAADLVPADQDEKLDVIATMALILQPSLVVPAAAAPGVDDERAALADLDRALARLAGADRGAASSAA